LFSQSVASLTFNFVEGLFIIFITTLSKELMPPVAGNGCGSFIGESDILFVEA